MKSDVYGHTLEVGKKYRVGPARNKTRTVVTIEEDFESDCLLAVDSRGNRSRIEDLDSTNVFEPVDPLQAAALESDDLREQLIDCEERAAAARYQLETIENYACDLLGCKIGDGSAKADAVSRFVRDGYGSLRVYAGE